MEKPPPSRPPSVESERYLLYLETFGANKSGARIAKELELNRSTLTRWRADVIGFLDREKAIRKRQEQLAKTQKPQGSSPEVAAAVAETIDTTGLDLLQAKYLRNLLLLKDRIDAATATGVKWRDVVRWLATNDRFKEEFSAWEAERLVSLEDSLGKKGLRGDVSAARTVLAANDPRYRNKVAIEGTINHAHSLRENTRELKGTWLQQFKPQEPVALPADTVDAEVVHAG